MEQSAAPQLDITAAERVRIVAAIETAMNGYADAARRLDLGWFRDFWSNDGHFVIAADGALLDHETWDRQLEADLAGIREMTEFEFSNGHTYVLALDAAVHTTQFRWALVDHDGGVLRMHGSWSYVFKHMNGSWKVVHSAGTHLPD